MKNTLTYLICIIFATSCASISPIVDKGEYYELVVKVPKNTKNGDKSADQLSSEIYIVNTSDQEIVLCHKVIPINTTVTLSINEIDECGGTTSIKSHLESVNKAIFPLKTNEQIWIVESK